MITASTAGATGANTAFKTTRAAAGRPLAAKPAQSYMVMLRAAALTDDPDLERLVHDMEDARKTPTDRASPNP